MAGTIEFRERILDLVFGLLSNFNPRLGEKCLTSKYRRFSSNG